MKREGVLNFLCDLNTMSPLFTPFHTWCQRYSKDTKPILDNFQKILKGKHTSLTKYWNLFHHADTLRTQMARVKQQTEEGKKSHCKTIESSYCTASSAKDTSNLIYLDILRIHLEQGTLVKIMKCILIIAHTWQYAFKMWKINSTVKRHTKKAFLVCECSFD